MEEGFEEFDLRRVKGSEGLKDESPLNERERNFRLKEDQMITEDDFGAIQSLKRQGMKKKKIARVLGLDIKTVRKYWKAGKYERHQAVKKPSLLDPYREHLLQRLPETDYCAAVCLLEIRKMGYEGGYTILKDLVRPLREEQKRIEEATIRFETGPGKQAQVDWGSTRIWLAGNPIRIHLFVMVLGYSRRIYVRSALREDLASLIDCHERAFEWFGGLTETILYDNPKTICLKRDFEGKDITWNPQFMDFARYHGFRANLCKPYRARTKGKVESGVKYVKGNFFRLYGRVFDSSEELNQKLESWTLEVADRRIHGTTHEKPSIRFNDERLMTLEGKAPYRIEIPLTRIIPADGLVVFKTNRYSVPWAYVGKTALLEECGERLKIYADGELLADHPILAGKYRTNIIPGHYQGLLRPQAKSDGIPAKVSIWPHPDHEVEERALASYEALLTGGAS